MESKMNEAKDLTMSDLNSSKYSYRTPKITDAPNLSIVGDKYCGTISTPSAVELDTSDSYSEENTKTLVNDTELDASALNEVEKEINSVTKKVLTNLK